MLYERYFPSLYDFAQVVLVDRRDSAKAVEETFVQAMKRLRLGVRPERVKAWLFALARENSIAALRSADHIPVTAPAVRELAQGDVGWPFHLLETCGPLDRSLLDLHLRRELPADDLAAALSLEPRIVRARLARLTEAFGQAAAWRLLVGDGRSECPIVNELLREVRYEEARLSPRLLWRHAKGCHECQAALRRGGATPDAIVSAPLAPQPLNLAEEVWRRLCERIGEREAAWQSRALVPGIAAVALAGTVVAIAIVPGRESETGGMSLGTPSGQRPALGRTASLAAPDTEVRVAAPPPAGSVEGSQRLTTPDEARPPSQARTFSWAPAAGAVAYSVAFFRDSNIVFERRTKAPRLTLPSSWTYGGRAHSLRPGTYRWVVWPILDADGRRAEKAIVAASMVVD